jgi:rod shape-determining protein MreC
LQVAKVVQVENKATTTFENVLCSPTAGIDRNKQLLILLVETDQLARPDTEEVKTKKEKFNRKVTRDNAIEAGRENPAERTPLLEQKAVESTSAPTSVSTPAPAPAATSASDQAASAVAPANRSTRTTPTVQPSVERR